MKYLRAKALLRTWFALSLMAMIIALTLTPALAQSETEDKQEQPRRFGVIPVPVLFYTPETGVAGGASAIFFFRSKDAAPETRSSKFGLLAFYTQYRQYSFSGGPSLYLDDENWIIDINAKYKKFPDKYYGIGNETKFEDEEIYTPFITEVHPEFSRRIYSQLYLGLLYDYIGYNVVDVDGDDELSRGEVLGADEGRASAMGFTLRWDSRDNDQSAEKGGYYRLDSLFYDGAFGSDFGYNRFKIDLRKYLPVAEDQIVAFQLLSEITVGDPPFHLYSKLGGNSMMRGTREGRFRDLNMAAVQAEYRFGIWRWLRGGLFAGTGDIAERIFFLYPGEFKGSIGGGLRFELNKKERIRLRADIAYGPEGTGFYFVFGEAF